MAKNCGEWGRDKARERYQSGGKVSVLHPAGTFSNNSDKTDTHAVLRRALGMPDPPSASVTPLRPLPTTSGKAKGGAVEGSKSRKGKK